jgi:hypothetical protein
LSRFNLYFKLEGSLKRFGANRRELKINRTKDEQIEMILSWKNCSWYCSSRMNSEFRPNGTIAEKTVAFHQTPRKHLSFFFYLKSNILLYVPLLELYYVKSMKWISANIYKIHLLAIDFQTNEVEYNAQNFKY